MQRSPPRRASIHAEGLACSENRCMPCPSTRSLDHPRLHTKWTFCDLVDRHELISFSFSNRSDDAPYGLTAGACRWSGNGCSGGKAWPPLASRSECHRAQPLQPVRDLRGQAGALLCGPRTARSGPVTARPRSTGEGRARTAGCHRLPRRADRGLLHRRVRPMGLHDLQRPRGTENGDPAGRATHSSSG